TSFSRDWSSDVCSSDLLAATQVLLLVADQLLAELAHAQRADVLQRQLDIPLGPGPGADEVGCVGVVGRSVRAAEDVAQHVVDRKIGRASCRERVEVSVM